MKDQINLARRFVGESKGIRWVGLTYQIQTLFAQSGWVGKLVQIHFLLTCYQWFMLWVEGFQNILT